MILATITGHGDNLPMGFVKSLLSAHEYTHIFQEGASIPDNRNKVFEMVRVMNDDLLFIDSDMVFTPDDVKRMEEHLKDKDVVTGVCVMGFPGWPAAIFKEDDGKYKLVKPLNEVHEIDACGAAFLGISKKVIHTLIEPFSLIEYSNGVHGEDISFCIRAKQAEFKIFCDPKLKIGHIKPVTKYYEET